ncbi:tetratricopeptide repeat protein [Telmatobacter bradus]|uniref:tetratricopeptide repeat protein n=1 Tax=Telmatobacter bradus TaxID=474953 RepID=UPI003B42D9FE
MRFTVPARRALRHALLLCSCGMLAAVPVLRAQHDALAQLHAALDAGEADHALAVLRALPQSGENNAEAQNLACRVHYSLQQWDAAENSCEKAIRLDRNNANNHLWLGRALGEKAGHASFLSAYSLGKRARSEFEQAVHLNPHNVDALTDLGEFYEEAPSVVGGGYDKAEQIAQQLDHLDPAHAHQLRARIAEAQKDYGTAEREYKAAIAVSAHPALHWTTLASFFRRRKRWQDLDWAIHNTCNAAKSDKHATVALYDGAGVLTEANRNTDLAVRMLETYLTSDSKTEEGPAFEAHLRLAKLKKSMGDRAGAENERSAALALAHDYKPAQEAKF